MASTSTIALTTDVGELAGIGPNRAEAFRRLGIRCVAELLLHLPMRYEKQLGLKSIAEAGSDIGTEHGDKADVTVEGEVAAIRLAAGRRPRVEAMIEDGTATAQLVWFNAPWMQRKISPGMRLRVTGTGRRYGDYLQIVNPLWEILQPEDESDGADSSHAIDQEPRDDGQHGPRLRPIYPAGEGLKSIQIEQAIDAILDDAVACLNDHLPQAYRQSRDLMSLAESYRAAHHPSDQPQADAARRRLAFDELLLLQLGVMMKRYHRHDILQATALRHSDAMHCHILERFPFSLTEAQQGVIKEIADDLQQPKPMNRLLQGDVGAGKTVVALYAMLMAVANQCQAALMAPTELLAEQHFDSICRMLQHSDVTIELLTGSMRPSQRAMLLDRIRSGEIHIIIGTHALLTETVEFNALAVAVIDEQHRFGVHQRAALRAKAGDDGSAPHVLVMTATPIPRTLSLTVFGDLDISTIRTLPPGRTPVITRHVRMMQAAEVYAYLADRVAAGEQGYVVVPAIDSGGGELTDLTSLMEHLKRGPLQHCRVASVHGRMDRPEREAIMNAFRAGNIDVLIATTVIEVGVDVANATMMIIENADRFGLAQLHQLRGRVGRSEKPSLCVLIAEPITDEGGQRIAAMLQTNDGFVIAERDLEIRGPGDLFGLRQSGAAPFRVARLPDDLELLHLARRDAQAWIQRCPDLGGDEHALLRKRLLKAHGKWLGLGDVA